MQYIFNYIYVYKSKYAITETSLMIGRGCKLFTEAVNNHCSKQKTTSIVRQSDCVHSFTSETLHCVIHQGFSSNQH